MKQPLKPDQIVHRLRLMAESGGMITRDRRNVIIEAADMIELMDERIAIMSECKPEAGDLNGQTG